MNSYSKSLLCAVAICGLFCSSAYGGLVIDSSSSTYPSTITDSEFDTFFAQKNADDYGNAPGYDNAKNKMGVWQRLGTIDDTTDGVSWSVDGSDFGTIADLVAGEEVVFKFDLWQSNTGKHDYDQIISFVDWDHDGEWASDKDTLWQDDASVETILYQQSFGIQNSDNGYQYDKDYMREKSWFTSYYLTLTIPVDAILGETWMRTRVHCNHTEFPNITPYNNLGQGETLDLAFNIVSPVPEPTTMLLFGTGIAGLAGVARKRRK